MLRNHVRGQRGVGFAGFDAGKLTQLRPQFCCRSDTIVDVAWLTLRINDKRRRNAKHAPRIGKVGSERSVNREDLQTLAKLCAQQFDGGTLDRSARRTIGRGKVHDGRNAGMPIVQPRQRRRPCAQKLQAGARPKLINHHTEQDDRQRDAQAQEQVGQFNFPLGRIPGNTPGKGWAEKPGMCNRASQ